MRIDVVYLNAGEPDDSRTHCKLSGEFAEALHGYLTVIEILLKIGARISVSMN